MTRTTIPATGCPKLVVATALAIAALAATPLAEAGLGMPQKHPDARSARTSSAC